jgi:hypothetical protein
MTNEYPWNYHQGDPDASDKEIAEAIADFLLVMYSLRRYCLSIICPSDPAPADYDWRREDVVGINTRDRDRARQWAIDAARAGYSVRRSLGPERPKFFLGALSIASVRADRAQR